MFRTSFPNTIMNNVQNHPDNELGIKTLAIAVALLLHGTLLAPLLLTPVYEPATPMATESFEFISLPQAAPDEDATAVAIAEPIIEQPITQPEVQIPPPITETPTQEIASPLPMAAPPPVAEAEEKPLPNPVSRPRPKPVAKPAQAKKSLPRVETAPQVTKQKQATDKQVVQGVMSKNTYTPPIGRTNLLNNPKPIYPTLARRRGLEGLVLLVVDVDSHGNPLGVKVKRGSGYSILDRSALQTVKKMAFYPGKNGGYQGAGIS